MARNSVRAAPRIPSVDAILRSDSGTRLISDYGRSAVTDAIRDATAILRKRFVSDQMPDQASGHALPDDPTAWITDAVETQLAGLFEASLRPVINLTGTVLHTNLGRAPLPESCIDAVTAVARGASNLEYRLTEGRRGDRDEHVEKWLCRLTGAEAATVVNNNAAAVLLVLNALAENEKVAVSRGELIEIGGSFRIPDIMRRAYCQLAEVGTTNRTHLKDYQAAVEDGAVAVMRVHTSNYVVQGFTAEVDDDALGQLARERDVLFINDLGSGALIDMQDFGLPQESTPADAIASGADVVTFSGDKLLGGPQCGLIVGTHDVIARIKKNPMKRAMRCDKMTLAALESILRLYADPTRLTQEVPALRLLTREYDEICETAATLAEALRTRLGQEFMVTTQDCASQIGSGALPVDTLASHAVVITPKAESGAAVERLAESFRRLERPVIGRISDGGLVFDMRCLESTAEITNQLHSLAVD